MPLLHPAPSFRCRQSCQPLLEPRTSGGCTSLWDGRSVPVRVRPDSKPKTHCGHVQASNCQLTRSGQPPETGGARSQARDHLLRDPREPQLRPAYLVTMASGSSLLGRQLARGATWQSARIGSMHPAEPGVCLRLVGKVSREFAAELRQLADELGVGSQLEILEPVSAPSTQFAWCDALLMCSSEEAFGRVTAEALRHGRPVIGSRSGGTPEIVTDEIDGLLVDPDDASSLARALERLVRDPDLLDRLTACARSHNADRFTREQVMAVGQVIDSVVPGRPSKALE